MGGRLLVESEIGKGSTFSFNLRFPTISNPKIVAASATPAAFGEGRLILLAEDNEINQEVAKYFLEMLGFSVVIAEDGQKVVPTLVDHPEVVAILMDVQMPVMGGFEATATVRESHLPFVPIIAMTAHAMEGDRDRCIAAGMDDYVSKPIRFQKLAEVLHQWVS
jgi:CheY-like chemotaxis protein